MPKLNCPCLVLQVPSVSFLNASVGIDTMLSKSITAIAFSLLSFSTYCQTIIIGEVEYDVQIMDYDVADYLWYRHNIEASSRIYWITDIIAAVNTGEINAFDINNIHKQLSPDQAINTLYKPHPITIFDSLGNEITIHTIDGNPESSIRAIRFREKWYLDTITMVISKELLAFSFLIGIVENQELGSDITYIPLFWIKPTQTNIQQDVTRCIEYWVELPKGQHDSNTLYHNNIKHLESLLLDNLKRNTAYLGYQGFPCELGDVWNGDYSLYYQSVVIGLAFREKWDWLPEFGLRKKTIAYSLLLELKDSNGNSKGRIPWVWIKNE